MECFTEIKEFLTHKGESYIELDHDDWVIKLMFLTGTTTHLHNLNIRLRFAGQTILSLYVAQNAFVTKLAIINADVKTGNLGYFKHLKMYVSISDASFVSLKVYMSEHVRKLLRLLII